jgi:tetratricopeptide (TPR) repeat protein
MKKSILFILLLFIFALPQMAQTPTEWHRTGDKAYRQDSIQKAVEAYGEATRLAPDSAQLTYNLGNALYKSGQAEAAAKPYQDAIKNSQTKPQVEAKSWHNLGNIAMEKKDYQAAIHAYKKSLRLTPGAADTKNNLQLAKQKLKEQEQEKQKSEQKKEPQQEKEKEQNQGEEQEQNTESKPLDQDEVERSLQLLESEEKKVKRRVQKGPQNSGTKAKKRW